MSWLLPNHYVPWLNFPSEAMAVGSIAALTAATLFTFGSAPIHWPCIALWTSVAALIPWAQWLLGIGLFGGDALMVSFYLAGWSLAIVVGFRLAGENGGQSMLALMHMLWISALGSAMIGLLQWLKLEGAMGIFAVQTDIGDPAMGNLGQPNQLATLLLMGMAAYAYIFERRVIGAAIFALGIAFMTAILVMTHSRAGMLGVLELSSFLLWKRSAASLRISAHHVVGWVLLFAALSFLSPHVDSALQIYTDHEALFSANGRMLIWSQAIEGIRHSPWLGYGWDRTFTAISVGALTYPGELVSTYAHNVLLDMVVWNGVPLGLILIGLGAYWFCTRLYRVTGLAGTYAMACLLPFTNHSMVEYPFAYAYFLLSAGLLMGFVEASMADARVWKIPRFWVASTLAIWAIVGCVIAYEYLLIEEDTRVTRFENLAVGTTDAVYQPPKIYLLTHMAALQRATRQQPAPHMTAPQLEDMRRAVLRFPTGGLTLRYAMALAMNGDPHGARQMMKVIRGLYGEQYYISAKEVWHQKAEKYTELKLFDIPA